MPIHRFYYSYFQQARFKPRHAHSLIGRTVTVASLNYFADIPFFPCFCWSRDTHACLILTSKCLVSWLLLSDFDWLTDFMNTYTSCNVLASSLGGGKKANSAPILYCIPRILLRYFDSVLGMTFGQIHQDRSMKGTCDMLTCGQTEWWFTM